MSIKPVFEVFRTAGLGEELRMFEFQYKYGNANGLLLLNSESQPYATLSINMPDEVLAEDQFIIKDYSENEDIAEMLYSRGVFVDTGRRIRTGFVVVPVWRFLRQKAESMPTFEVYYAREPVLSMTGDQEVSVAKLKQTHVALLSLKASDMDEVFQIMQGENWSPKGQARRLIIGKGLQHTSMSVGDVVKQFTPNGPTCWKAVAIGWEEIK